MREHITSLQRQVSETTKRLKDLVAKAEGEHRDLTAEEQASFTKDEGDVKSLKARLERAQTVEREGVAQAVPAEGVLNGADTPKSPASHVTTVERQLQPGVAFGRFIAAVAIMGKGGRREQGVAWYKKNFGEGEDLVLAALNATDGGSGGYTVPTGFYRDLLPLLQAKTVMRRAGVIAEPMPNGNITIVRSLTGASFTRVAEGTAVNASNPTFGALTLTARKMIGKIPISNDLIRYSAYSIDQSVPRDAVRGIQVAEDTDFLRGTGIGAIPKGLRYIATGANLLTMTGTPDVAKITNDLQRCVLALASANVPMSKCFWVFAPRVALYLQFLLNSNGVRVFPEMADGFLFGYPFFMTTSIPVNLGGGSNESEIYFADADELLIGDGLNVQVDVSTEASYLDETGTLVSAFDKDQTIVRIMLANDFGAFHPQSVCVMTGVTWGG